ncbi:ABC transporter ATP-binding protein [Actinocrispum wychmicini]|uniref:ATP-binding cassette subfamily B protein n=1 Tax=Actinocrispum wychmicini TaxID=1213861 RepID=A0A4R2JU41_9PSEU|nr:ABC transporter ATP-binding protein [Actinocrispum wychmicini]TCO60818.1 ATP-binding cassette subfamily B protein [Actinocrispum wychmicini]
MSRFATWRRSVAMLFTLCFRADLRRSLTLFGYAIAINVLQLTATVGVRPLVDSASRGDTHGVMIAAGVIAVAVALASLCGRGFVALTASVMERAGLLIDAKLIELAAGVPTVDHYERPRYVDQMTLVRQERRVMAQMMNAMALNLQSFLYLVGAVVLLGTIDPWLLLLPVFGVPALLAHRRSTKLALKARQANAQPTLLRNHLYKVASSPAAGKELRVYGLTDEFVARHRATADAMERTATRASLRGVVLSLVSSLIFAVGYIGAAATVLGEAIDGLASVGSVVLAVALAALVNSQVSSVVQSGTYFQQVLKTAERLVWLTDYAAGATRRDGEHTPVPARLTSGIELKDVSFSYPDTEKVVLDRVNLTLPTGAVVALVGDNGSGKTTLVKLLTGMYRPTSGTITVDGVGLDSFVPAEWQRRARGAFQDFARFELLLGQTVGIGDMPRMDDQEAVVAALSRAGAAEMAEVEPQGLRTQLGTAWGGVDLSGGQWQKLALGRAVMAEDPLVVVLDEPTAALDAPTEHATFERFARIAAAGANRGHVTLLVSHRFTTVRMADFIVVLQKGTVVETGTHAELIAARGLYAELYALQQKAYS